MPDCLLMNLAVTTMDGLTRWRLIPIRLSTLMSAPEKYDVSQSEPKLKIAQTSRALNPAR